MVLILPPVETTPVLLMRFTKLAPPDLILFVKQRLSEEDIVVVCEENDNNSEVILGLSTKQHMLEMEAEHIKLVKPSTPDLTYMPKALQSIDTFFVMESYSQKTRKDYLNGCKSMKVDHSFSAYDTEELFSSSDRVNIIWSLLESLRLQKRTDSQVGRGRFFANNLIKRLEKLGVFDDTSISSRFLGVNSVKSEVDMCSKYLLQVLKEGNLVDLVAPVHLSYVRDKLCAECLNPMTTTPLQGMRDYYGEDVTYYFAWMKFYTNALFVPGLSGILVWSYNRVTNETVDDSIIVPFHSLTTFFWSVFFVRFWKREQNRLAYDWGTYSSTGYEKNFFSKRPEFTGTLKKSNVTGELEIQYPTTKRLVHYFVSGLVTFILLCGAFFMMILSLNLQGYVHCKHNPGRWGAKGPETSHPFHYPMFSVLSEDGNIFDAASQWRCFIPVIIHVLMVLTMNKTYRRVAEVLTKWENHETENDFDNSLTFKRFLFEAFDAYLVLFYLAFYEQDIDKLRSELVNIFNIDTIRRLFLECIVPFVTQKITKPKLGKKHDLKKSDFIDPSAYNPLLVQSHKDEYELFDDYLEMVIQFGHITLFASAYPLAPFVAIFANFLEVRFDGWKLSHVHLRPMSRRSDGIGNWEYLITAIVWLSALTNCMIFCFTSMQLYQWLPGYFVVDDEGEHDLSPGSGWMIVFIVFGIERFLIYSGNLINMIIPEVPQYVIEMEERREYVYFQEHQNNRSAKGSLKSQTMGTLLE